MDVLSNIVPSDSALKTINGRFQPSVKNPNQICMILPFFRPIVLVGRSLMGVAFGFLYNVGVVRVNVATLEGEAFGISRTITKRLDLTSGSSLGFRLRPHNRRDPKPRRDHQNGTKKKSVRAGAIGRKKGVLPLDCLHWRQGAHRPPPSPAGSPLAVGRDSVPPPQRRPPQMLRPRTTKSGTRLAIVPHRSFIVSCRSVDQKSNSSVFQSNIDSVLAKTTCAAISIRHWKTTDARIVGRLFVPLWRVVNTLLRERFQDVNYIVPILMD